MRSKIIVKQIYGIGATRIIRKFLLFPKRLEVETQLKGKKAYQWRWLEKALIKQELIGGWCSPTYWIDLNWAD